jgi:hypothetical protein
MKKWLKWTLIVVGVLFVFGIIIEVTKSPEQRAKEEREKYVRDSTQRAIKDSIDNAGIGVSFSEATNGMSSANWKEVDNSMVLSGDGVRILMSGDTSNLSSVIFYMDPSTNVESKIIILKSVLINVIGQESASKILTDIGRTIQKRDDPSPWTIGEKKKLSFGYDKKTGEFLLAITRNKPDTSDKK